MNIILAQRIIGEFFLDFLYLPIWWYSRGAIRVINYMVHLFLSSNARLAPGLWMKNIFVPMYGQSDLQGRLMSFFMRLVNVIGRSLVLFFFALLLLFLLFLWILFPVFVVIMFFVSFF